MVLSWVQILSLSLASLGAGRAGTGAGWVSWWSRQRGFCLCSSQLGTVLGASSGTLPTAAQGEELPAGSSLGGLYRSSVGVAAVRCRRVRGARLALAPSRSQLLPSWALPALPNPAHSLPSSGGLGRWPPAPAFEVSHKDSHCRDTWLRPARVSSWHPLLLAHPFLPPPGLLAVMWGQAALLMLLLGEASLL